jgi:hypothetical protein
MRRLYHPLWTHFFALAGILITVYMLWRVWPQLPSSIPVQFDFSGTPIRHGARWELLGIPALMLFYLLGAVLLDELWARQERRKTFNWLAPLDELIIGAMAGVWIGYLGAFFNRGYGMMQFQLPWIPVLLVAGGAVAGAVILELLRPWIPFPYQAESEDTSAIRAEIAQRVRSRERWVHWEAQNPAWINAAIVLASAMMFAGAALSYKLAPFAAALLAASAVALVLLLTGGLRTAVTPDRIEIRLGLVGLRVFRLPLAAVAEVKLRNFAPLREFGGYGIRWNGKMTAYFFRGNRGVLLRTDAGKQYLIGSDRPERLAAVVEAAKGTV